MILHRVAVVGTFALATHSLIAALVASSHSSIMLNSIAATLWYMSTFLRIAFRDWNGELRK